MVKIIWIYSTKEGYWGGCHVNKRPVIIEIYNGNPFPLRWTVILHEFLELFIHRLWDALNWKRVGIHNWITIWFHRLTWSIQRKISCS